MAGGQERILRRRIRSVEATKKITRAMELIAASQMVRAQQRITGSRPYLRGIAQVLADVAGDGSAPGRLVGTPQSPENVAVIAIVSDRGLCGGYNAFVLRATERLVRTGEQAGRHYTLAAAGKKAVGYFRFRGRTLDRSFPMPDRPSYGLARELAQSVVPRFLSGELDLVQLVSTRFVSSGVQVVETRQLLPIEAPERPDAPRVHAAAGGSGDPGTTTSAPPPPGSPAEGGGGEAGAGGAAGAAASSAGASPGSSPGMSAVSDEVAPLRDGFFEFEPAPEDLLALLVPRYAEAAIYQALLEASASEHVARQRAMSAATENADDLIKNLRRVMNRARQDSITTEIMEIVGGAEALRQGGADDSSPMIQNDYTIFQEQTA